MKKGTSKVAHETLLVYIQKQRLSKIRSSVSKTDKPVSVWDKEADKRYTPDASAYNVNTLYLYEIEDCQDFNETDSIEKWKTFSAFSIRKQGRFYLVIPESKSRFINDLLEKHEIEARLIRMKSL